MSSKIPASVFGRRLRAARIQADIPQDKLGVMIGLDETTASARMSRYETGTHEPPFSTAVKIAEALHIPTAYLFCEDDVLAELILVLGKLSKVQLRRVIAQIAHS